MPGWFIGLLTLHIVVGVLLIIIILIQQRTKGGIAGVLGGGGGMGGAEQIFGSSGIAPVITKLTVVLGTVFLAMSLGLMLISVRVMGHSQGQLNGGSGQQQVQSPANLAPIPDQNPKEKDLIQDQDTEAPAKVDENSGGN